MNFNKLISLCVLGLFLALSGCETEEKMILPGQESDVLQQRTSSVEVTTPVDVDAFFASLDMPRSANTVGLMGAYHVGFEVAPVLAAGGYTVVQVDQAFIDNGDLSTLHALFIDRYGAALANANAAAIESWVRAGGILITEFDATITVLYDYGFCTAGSQDNGWWIPSGNVCGMNTVNVVDPSSPLAKNLPSSWCTGDPIGVFLICQDLDPDLHTVIELDQDVNGDGVNDPVVAYCCADNGIWIAFFTDFADFTPLAEECNPNCERVAEEEELLLNAVNPAVLNCCDLVVPFDIHPTSCPNPLNIKSKGKLPVAILGSGDLDVSTLDVESISLMGVSPLMYSFEDVATPEMDPNDPCLCTTAGPDGYTDLTLKFDTQEVVEALGAVNDGDIIVLTITGFTLDELPFIGEDCVVIIKK